MLNTAASDRLSGRRSLRRDERGDGIRGVVEAVRQCEGKRQAYGDDETYVDPSILEA